MSGPELNRKADNKGQTLLSNFVRREGLSSSACEQGSFISSDGRNWISFILSSSSFAGA